MAVIIREKRIMGGKVIEGAEVYKYDQFVTKKMREDAEKLDDFLKNKIEEIRSELKKLGLIDCTGKEVLKMRYELGRMLSFIGDDKIINPADRKYIWRALYDHAQDLASGPPDERANNRPETSFFSYCYKLGKFPWEMINSGGDWSSWQRFFDLAIKKDERILSWLSKKRDKLQSALKKNWLKETTKALTQQFKNRDTTVLTEEELEQELEQLLSNLKENS